MMCGTQGVLKNVWNWFYSWYFCTEATFQMEPLLELETDSLEDSPEKIIIKKVS